ncbi:hypothetical protein NLJ89_g3305 [Agrocybe chaxingu]|uniref:AAA+ ATPase domain-containing protein n=1 Tax=Agrocybe chaxingu TaxID=84603 RepID=A0A9W8MYJ1_9AGAR|nr:hypothetical protein NLJ89_g3305 [Agrocybe chaxingu]
MAAPWAVPGSRGLCRNLVNRDFKRARQLLEISPTLINVRHPLGWAPFHAVILCGDPSIVKFVLDLPGIDITIKDISTFNITSQDADILCRQQELCMNICTRENTSGATALHFACMRGDLEILNLLLKTHIAHDVRDDSKRLPPEYFDLDRVNLETFDAYRRASKAWYRRWRSLATKDMTALCGAIRDGDEGYCKEILDSKPELARDQHPSILEALQVAVTDRKPADVNVLLPSSSTSGSSDSEKSRKRGSTPLHYSCLMGNMRIAEILLRNGAEWTMSDSNDLLPEGYAALNGDNQMQEFKRLCEKEALIRVEEDELRLAGRFAEELELERAQEKQESERLKKRELEAQKEAEEKKLREEEELRKKQADIEKEAERKKKRQEEEESRKKRLEMEKEKERKRKLQEEEELRKRHLEIEKVIGDKIIGQRGPIRSIASAIRLRENGWVDPDRPLVMLFLGSSGIGKTELAKQVAHYLHGDDYLHGYASENSDDSDSDDETSSGGRSLTGIEQSGAFVRLDMSEYQHSHTVSNLTGSPKGYVGYDEGGILTKKLKKNPKAIVLLDEIEKAHPNVLTVFLQVFDDGRITDPKLGTIYCKGAVFIMTSNLGSEQIKAESPKLHKLVAKTEGRHEQYLRGIGQFNKQLYPILKGALKRDEFLGRINQTVVFLPLSDQEIGQIVEIELKKWKKRAEEHHAIKMSWSRKGKLNASLARLVQGYNVNYGARSVINEVQTLAVQVLAESQIRGDIRKNWLVHLFINDTGSIDMAKEDPIGRIPQRGCHYVF